MLESAKQRAAAELPRRVREASADDLVWRLREMGVEQIMSYGSDPKVRIQSIGSPPTQAK